MKSKFRHVALFGKYHTTVTGAALESSRRVLDDVAQFVSRIGAEVVLEEGTSEHLGLNLYPTLKMADIGKQCDLGVVIGGDGTMSIAHGLADLGLRSVGVPKTIDNDIVGCERSFGFDTAVATATDGLMRIETTAMSHSRVMIVETMGRHAGWIALEAGLAAAADVDAAALGWVRMQVMKLSEMLTSRFFVQGNVAAHRKAMRSMYVGGCVVAGIFTLLPGRLLGNAVWGWLIG